MKIHAIKLSKDMLINIFGNGERHYLIENGLSDDAVLIGIGRISGSIDYEIIFEAESGVEVADGSFVMYMNPTFTTISKEIKTFTCMQDAIDNNYIKYENDNYITLIPCIIETKHAIIKFLEIEK